MKKTVKLFLLTILVGLVSASCKREGCTDNSAKNFDSKAKTNCCCEYSGSVVFWYGKTASESLITGGSTSLTYYVDGAVVGSGATSVYWTAAPDCDQSGSVTVKKELGDSKSKSYPYVVKDQDGDVIYQGNVTLTGNTCLAFELK